MFLGWKPHAGQRLFLETKVPIKVLACGRRWGKSEACAHEIVQALNEPAPREVLIVAPTQDQCLPIFDKVCEILQRQSRGPAVLLRRSPRPMLRYGGSRLLARSSASEGRYLRGRKAHLIVVDEAAFLQSPVILETLLPMVADTGGRIVLASTPHGKNHFFALFAQGQIDEGRVWSQQCPSWQNPLLSPVQLDWQRDSMSGQQFGVEYEAQFVDPAGQVFKSEWLEKAVEFGNSEIDSDAPIVAGIDWARYHDYTALAIAQGYRSHAAIRAVYRWHRVPWQAQAQQIAQTLRAFHVERALCDRTGAGDAAMEILEPLCDSPIEGIVFNAAHKGRLIDQLALALEKGSLGLPNEETLLNELRFFEAVPRDNGVKLSAPIGGHDDLVIATALALDALPAPYHTPICIAGKRRV